MEIIVHRHHNISILVPRSPRFAFNNVDAAKVADLKILQGTIVLGYEHFEVQISDLKVSQSDTLIIGLINGST